MFDMTSEGCKEATEYLKQINEFYKVEGQDGFTIVHYANWLKRQVK